MADGIPVARLAVMLDAELDNYTTFDVALIQGSVGADGTGGTEASGGGYARQTLTRAQIGAAVVAGTTATASSTVELDYGLASGDIAGVGSEITAIKIYGDGVTLVGVGEPSGSGMAWLDGQRFTLPVGQVQFQLSY